MNSRKFYAVPEDDLMAPVQKKLRRTSPKTIDLTDNGSCSCDGVLEGVKSELEEVNSKIDQISNLTKDSPVPIGLKKLLKDAFKCKICHITPMVPPVIATKCCKSLLGCQECVDTWYATDPLTKSCPACNAARGFVETLRLHGLDDFMMGLQSLMKEEEQAD